MQIEQISPKYIKILSCFIYRFDGTIPDSLNTRLFVPLLLHCLPVYTGKLQESKTGNVNEDSMYLGNISHIITTERWFYQGVFLNCNVSTCLFSIWISSEHTISSTPYLYMFSGSYGTLQERMFGIQLKQKHDIFHCFIQCSLFVTDQF